MKKKKINVNKIRPNYVMFIFVICLFSFFITIVNESAGTAKAAGAFPGFRYSYFCFTKEALRLLSDRYPHIYDSLCIRRWFPDH